MIWLKEQQVLKIENPCKRLFKKGKKARDEWSDFSATEVQTILSKENLVFDAKRPSRYWIPWVLAHCGAQEIEEICALYRDDIQKVPDTSDWYMLIREDRPDKKIKNGYGNPRNTDSQFPCENRLSRLRPVNITWPTSFSGLDL